MAMTNVTMNHRSHLKESTLCSTVYVGHKQITRKGRRLRLFLHTSSNGYLFFVRISLASYKGAAQYITKWRNNKKQCANLCCLQSGTV